MRGCIVPIAVFIGFFGSESARSQQDAQTKRTEAVQQRGQMIFKEWAKVIRETRDAAKRMQRKQAERDAWTVRSAKAKEDKMRARYRLSLNQLFLIIKRGLAEKWPTDKPEDLSVIEPIVAQRQAYLDSMIFEQELNAWVEAQIPPRQSRVMSATEFASSMQADVLNGAAMRDRLRKNAPLTVCRSKLPDGKTCSRKVVGTPGRRCYEHRNGADGAEED
jgi:hypothetical protein